MKDIYITSISSIIGVLITVFGSKAWNRRKKRKNDPNNMIQDILEKFRLSVKADELLLYKCHGERTSPEIPFSLLSMTHECITPRVTSKLKLHQNVTIVGFAVFMSKFYEEDGKGMVFEPDWEQADDGFKEAMEYSGIVSAYSYLIFKVINGVDTPIACLCMNYTGKKHKLTRSEKTKFKSIGDQLKYLL